MCFMVKKWQTVTEAHVDVKTTDGYLLHLFCVGFTKKRRKKQQSGMEDISRSAPIGTPTPEGDENHNLRVANKWLERSDQ